MIAVLEARVGSEVCGLLGLLMSGMLELLVLADLLCVVAERSPNNNLLA